jgi:hypothetical protein
MPSAGAEDENPARASVISVRVEKADLGKA